MRNRSVFKIFIAVGVFLTAGLANAANESPQTFTLDGQLYAADRTSPLLDAAAQIKVQILDPSRTCILYEEEQPVDTTTSNGHFTIQVGSVIGSTKRKAFDPGNTMQKVYQNSSAITALGPSCSGTYSPVLGAIRYVRVIVTPSAQAPTTLTPDMVLDAVPNAVVAQSLQGLEKEKILQSNPAMSVTQSKLEQFFAALSLAPGSSVKYDGTNYIPYDPSNGANLTAGSVPNAAIASVTWAKITSLPTGISAIASLSCANGEILKMVSGSWACATESGVGSESDPTVAAYAKSAPGAGLTVSGGAIVADFGTGAGKVVQGNDSRLSDARAPNGAASGDLSGTYPSPTVTKLQGRGVSVTAPADGQVLRYNNGASQWEPYNFGIGDLKTNTGTPQFISASCTASETLIWSSVTNTFSCTTIGINGSQVSGNIAGLATNVTGTVAIANGGTGQTTATAALNALLPSQSGANGKVLQSDGTNVSWQTVSGGGGGDNMGNHTATQNLNLSTFKLVGNGGSNGISIDSSGNVGVGSTAPTVKMDVDGIISSTKQEAWSSLRAYTASSTGAQNPELDLIKTRGTLASPNYAQLGDGLGDIVFKTYAGSLPINNWSASIDAIATENHSSTAQGSQLILTTTGNGSLIRNWRMVIDQNGNVGIGSNVPATKLDVNGTINATAMTINGVPVGTATGMTSLNGSSQVAQTFAAPGASGLAPNWSTNSGTGVHTLNIPMASTASVTAGLLSKTEYDTFNNKVGASYSLAGDVTGTPAATVVDRIKGKSVTTAPTVAGQVLRYDGTNITPNFISMFDLRSTVTGTQAFTAGCASNQTLTWTAATDNLACTNISLPAAQITGLATAETDPKVGANSTNYLSKWNGSALVASTVVEFNGNVGIGTTTPANRLSVVTEGTGTIASLESYGAAVGSQLAFRNANGTTAAPTNSKSADTLGQIIFTGYGATAPLTSSAAKIVSYATEDYSDATGAGDMRFYTRPTGSVAASLERMRIDSTGNIGVNTAAPVSTFMSVANSTGVAGRFITAIPNVSNNALIASTSPIHTVDGAYSDTGIYSVAFSRLPSGVTNSGSSVGLLQNTLRNYGGTGDKGTLTTQIGILNQYGHYSTDAASAPITTTAIGLNITPFIQTGTVTSMYDIYLAADQTGGMVTNRYGIYQANTANNVFMGKVGMGTTAPAVALDVAGSIRPGSSGVTTGGACTGEGSLAYDVAMHAPVYCNNSGVWSAMSGAVASGTFCGRRSVNCSATTVSYDNNGSTNTTCNGATLTATCNTSSNVTTVSGCPAGYTAIKNILTSSAPRDWLVSCVKN